MSREEEDLAKSPGEGTLGTWQSGCRFPSAIGTGSRGSSAAPGEAGDTQDRARGRLRVSAWASGAVEHLGRFAP